MSSSSLRILTAAEEAVHHREEADFLAYRFYDATSEKSAADLVKTANHHRTRAKELAPNRKER